MSKKVLIIDDEPDLLKVTSFRLQKKGYKVIMAEDGKDGLQIIREKRPDVVLLDLQIPGMNGVEVLKAVKADESIRDIPIVIFTANADEIKDIQSRTGADDTLLKPYEPEDLLGVIVKHAGEAS